MVVPTPDYIRLATHYGFAPDFCHANDPQSKGIVENLCGYAQRDLAVPLLTQSAVDGVPIDIRAANAAARRGATRSMPWRTRRFRRFPTNGWSPNAKYCNHFHRCAYRSGRPRCCTRSTDSPVCATARPATRYPPG
ncbi:hypothetical protein MSHO_56750 [Mycobacterium shottsii]|uniref:Uncharacterized protein n=1 Tax=Mycobacterium shottsii TaxID=133549 RepID=A0A7I7LL58_9MYCO|nr:hypothetical protein MSHO_56750 [Mycobacterium shottsii]